MFSRGGSTGSPSEKPTRVLTGVQLWGNASAIAAHGNWVRGFTNASVIIGVQKSGTTALGALPAHPKKHPPLTYPLTTNLLPTYYQVSCCASCSAFAARLTGRSCTSLRGRAASHSFTDTF